MADGFDFDKVKGYTEQAENPAAPAGARQASEAAAARAGDNALFDNSKIAKWVDDPAIGMTGAAQSWFSGANMQGPENGWSTPFIDTFFAQQDEAEQEGTLGQFFDRDGATGVVTWDHASQTDPNKRYTFGDIYEGGVKKGNLYDLYDQDTANLMMSTFTLDAKEKASVYKEASYSKGEGELRNPELDTLLQEKRAWNEVNLPKAFSAAAMENKVTEREESFDDAGVDTAIVAGSGVATGVLAAGASAAVAGAAAGSVVPGVGTAVVGGLGFLAGAGAAWLNKDSLTEQAARAYEITAMSREEFGLGAAVATGTGQWSKFGMRMISPASNTVQGLVDVRGASKVGDGEADFYKVNAEGERTTSNLAIGLDVGASIADGLLQFASPVGLAAYSGIMGGAVAGQVAELGITGGARFDDRSGTFDNVFYDTDPKTGEKTFDAASAAAGVGSIGIDAVQLGFARGLAGKVDAARAGVGARPTYFTGALDRPAQMLSGRLPKWMGGSTNRSASKEALQEGGREVRIGGFAYTLDEAGTAVSRRGTMSLLAPSEALTSITTGAIARRAAAVKDGALSTDDIYRAATALASGERKLTTAMVNAFGEGGEEMVQAALEPISHDANIDAQQMYLSAAYGFAGGLGIGLAANIHTPSSREILESQARAAHFIVTQGEAIDESRLKSMSDNDLRTLAATMNTAQREVAKTAYKKTVDALTASQTAGTAGYDKLLDAIRTAKDAELAKANPRVDGSFVITPLEGTGRVDADGNLDLRPDPLTGQPPMNSIPSHGVASSAKQMLANLRGKRAGLEISVQGLQREIERTAGDAELAGLNAKATADLVQAARDSEWLDRLLEALAGDVEQITQEANPAARAAHVAVLNHDLRQWYDGNYGSWRDGTALDDQAIRSIQRAVSMVYARDPHDSAGSYQALVPQVSLQLTVSDADNVLQVSSGILKAIRGDHDGDKLRPQNAVWLDDDAFVNLRSGANYLGTGATVHVDPPKQEHYTVEAIATANRHAADNPTLAAEATAALTNIGTAVKRRYGGRGVDAVLDRVLARFYDAVNANTKDARAVLLEGLAEQAGSVVSEVGRNSLSNEWLWIDQVVRSNFQAFQDVYAAHRALPAREEADLNILPEEVDTETKALHRDQRVKERRASRAATFGATMGLSLVGDSPFRMFQKLHYSSINSSVLSAEGMEFMELEDMAMAYERLGQQLTQTELERVRGIDEITGHVLIALERMAADAATLTQAASMDPRITEQMPDLRGLAKHEALVVIANTAVRDFEYDAATDSYRSGSLISMAQMLLKLEVQRDQEAKREILASSPTLQAKHARLLSLTRPGGGRDNSGVNAEKAFVEVFGAQQMGVLLGEEADVFGPQLTLEQFVRMYVHMSEDDRTNKKQMLTVNNAAYLGRKRTKNVPYSIEEIVETDDSKPRITPSRSVIDSVLAVGNSRVAELQERSESVSKTFVEAHASVRGVMRQMLQLDPKNGELTRELVERIIKENPDFARKVMELIPNASASVVFEVRGDEVYVNNWFYDMFVEKDGKAAEMIYWRAILLEGWRALGINDTDLDGYQFGRLQRRMHRIMYHVAPSKAGDEGVLESTFLNALWSATSVDKFIEWVNETPGMRRNEAPLVAWFDDVAEFDVDKANGGWTTSLAGAELREAIKVLASSSKNLLADVQEEQALLDSDIRYLRAIDRAEAHRNGEIVPGYSKDDEQVYRALQEAIDRAADTAVSLGPHAMVFQSTANAWGFYGQAHNKGKNPAHVEAYGMFDARRDAFGFVHNYSRVMGALTALDLDAVGSNLDMVAKDGGRTMDDYGRIVEWGKPTVKQMADLLRDPETRAFARALVQPTVLERTEEGGLSEQLLLGKSLEELLEGKTYNALFGEFDKLSQEQAFKYLALAESTARQFGGHMVISRWVNDIVIARINGARQTLSFEDVESMVTEAYYEAALLLQEVGSLAAREQVEGTNLLAALGSELKAERRAAHHAGRKGELGLADEALESFRLTMVDQFNEDLTALAQQLNLTTDPVLQAQIQARMDRLSTDHDLFTQRFEALLEEDELAQVISSFSLPSAIPLAPDEYDRQVAGVRRAIVEFVDKVPSLRERVPAVLPHVMSLQWQLSDPDNYGEVELSDAAWDELSRGIIGMVLTDSAGPVGAGVSIRLYPDEKAAADRRYYDRSFSYLIDPIIDPKSALVQAAAKLHLMAKRHATTAQVKDIAYKVSTTMFDEKRLGPWTEEVVIASVESNQRIDSAAAAQAVAISGQSPKLEDTVSAATSRTFEVPGPELLSTVSLTPRQLDLTLFDEVDITFPGAVVGTRPLAQLNNRFAASVLMTLPDGTQVDLLAENPDLGRTWHGSAMAPTDTGLYEIHLDRVSEALKSSAARHGALVNQVTVDIAFLHPDSQPAGAEWYNNLFFEGTSFKLDADVQGSLNETLWFALGSLSPEGQAAALDAAKNGKQAMQVIKAPSSGERSAAELGWQSDLAGVLRRKTQKMLATDLGFGALDPEMYNAVYKAMKLRHFVITEDGVLSAEDVVAAQAAGQTIDGQLWTPSDKVLRSMLGEQGAQGVPRVFDDGVDYDSFRIPAYRGVSEMMLERFADGLAGETRRLDETRIVHRPRQSRLVVRPVLPRKTRDAFAVRFRKMVAARDTGYQERNDLHRSSEHKFNERDNLNSAILSAGRMLKAENLSFMFEALGIPFIGPRNPGDQITSNMVLQEVRALADNDGRRTGWILRNNAPGDLVKGILAQVPLENQERPGMRILLGDIVVVELDSYADDDAKVRQQMDLLADKGATIVLGDNSGSSDLMGMTAAYIRSLGYESIVGSKHAYRPRESNSWYTVLRAREETLTEVRGLSTKGRAAVFNVLELPMQEGGSYLNPRATDTRGAIKVVSDLVPTSSMGGFGVPRRELRDDDQTAQVMRHLRGLDNADGLMLLQQLSHPKLSGDAKAKADAGLARAWRRMIERFDNPQNGVLPAEGDEFEIGDMIPLVDTNGHVVLYRHGHKRPDADRRKEMFRTPVLGRGLGGANVAVYTSEIEEAATTHSGTVVEFKPRAGYGLSVELEVPLQMFGNKEQLQWDGTKYTIVPWPDAREPGAPVLPGHTPLKNWDISLVSDIDTRLSKQGTDSMLNSHRNAFAFLGIDFLPDVSRFFFGRDDFTSQQTARAVLDDITRFGDKISVRQAHQLLHSSSVDTAFASMLQELSAQLQQDRGLDPAWVGKVGDDTDVSNQIATALLVYLSTPGASLDHVLRSGSFDDDQTGPDSKSVLMPQLFTQVFDDAPIGSPLRVDINRRLNARLNQSGVPGEGYRLMQNFDFISTTPERTMVGLLSFPEVHSSGDNPVTNGMSYQDGTGQQISAHSAATAAQAIGGRTFSGKVLGKAQAFKDAALGTGNVERFTPGVYDDGAVWRMMSSVPVKDRTYDLWSAPLPAEVERNGLAYDAMVGFRHPIDKTDTDRWSERELKAYADLQTKILDTLNLPPKLVDLVDGWARQMLGRPHGMELDGEMIEPMSGRQAIEAATDILDNISLGHTPTRGGFVPLLHVHDLKLIFRSNREAAHRWSLKGSPALDAEVAQSWDDYVSFALGEALESDTPFEMYYLLPTDGFMHSYQNATRDLTELPVSLNVLVNNQVLRMETNALLDSITREEIAEEIRLSANPSIDPRTTRLLSERIVLDTAKASLADLLNGQRIAGEYRGEHPPASEKAKQVSRIRRNRKERGMPEPVLKSMADYRANSTELLHHTTTSNALVRGLINLRVGMALFNPALYVSMPIEQGIRGSLDRVANLLVGQSTTGATAGALAGTTERLAGTRLGGALSAVGLEYNYTPDQLRQLNELYRVMATSPDFKSMVYGDLTYQRPYEPGSGRISHALENFAKAGSKLQDPTYGMRDVTLSRRYLEAALQDVQRRGTGTGLSVDRLIDEMHRNPLFLQKHFPEVHQAASNSLAQIRSLKQTPLSLALRWVYEPLSQNGKSPAANMFGNLVLRLPMIFSTYAGNVATTILGLQGLSDMSAMFLDGRAKGPNSMFGRIAAVMRGEQFDAQRDANFDMSSVLEGIDLSRSFLRGALTHTGLFTFALMAGNLGLSGEDEEAKRRRRANELQGAAMIYDPRKIENDFRNADAVYLDWLPFGFDSYFKQGPDGRALSNTHWMLRQFISPVIGIEKFMETGNFQHVKWGFLDALGSFPLINSNTVTDTLETMALFEQQAAEASLEGTDAAQVKAAGLLTSVVGGYERMLLENSFLSAIYVGMDEFDRDPYAKVMTDSAGTIQVDAAGLPRQSEKLEGFVDPDTGLPRTGYQSRSDQSTDLAILTENRPTMALVSSLFTGLPGDSEYWRYNMVPKTREIEKELTTEAAASSIIRAAFIGAGGQKNLTVEEAYDILKQQHIDAGVWYEPDEIQAKAEIWSKKAGLLPLSNVGPDMREFLTEDGAKAVLRGLYKGTVKITDESLRGIYITPPMREKIADDWAKELTAEGVAMGLNKSDALGRMKRIMYYGETGHSDRPTLGDIIWSKDISFDDTLKYHQLNTTYVMGPDGRPWATGFKRDAAPGAAGWFGGVLGAAGVMPLTRQHGAGSGAMKLDNLNNSVDMFHGVNTGLRGLRPVAEVIPTAEEMNEALIKAIEEAGKQDYSGFTPFAKRASGGYSGYSGYGGYTPYKRRSYSSGGGYSSSGYPNFTRMYTMPEGESPYGNSIPFINTSNPILRRGDVRRERVWSERGRLNQWQ